MGTKCKHAKMVKKITTKLNIYEHFKLTHLTRTHEVQFP